MAYQNDYSKCEHVCSSNCRRVGCNCACGNTHCDKCENTGQYPTANGVDDSEMIYCNCEAGKDKQREDEGFKRIPVVDMNQSTIMEKFAGIEKAAQELQKLVDDKDKTFPV